ncbi:ComEC/Rec2 family competence protein [Desulfosporosinus shakirovi]|uniref:ComEC/Rec2 family competence protein n=1 Tax=Desulfosporosinus shakirovi TaxID=2885154 RepID=UPI001E3AA34B|nr:ComEC/Rec2 family competence protein [Desulfosporosinus sp. SRJS8]MCB8818317.1 MBL fold metallo-hydrolase [Desulfosporosinus sp. SRJS8]
MKKIASLFMTILIALSLAGCGTAQADPTAASIKPMIEANTVESVKVDPLTSSTSPQASTDVVMNTTVLTGHKLKVSYIDVGQADSILIQTPGEKNILIDAGNNGDANTITGYLKSKNISKLDFVIATHSHEDHIGSLDTVIKTFDIGQIVMPKETSNTQTFRDVITAITEKGLKPIEAKAGVKLDFGSELYAELLAPNSSGYEDINDYSAVLRLIYGKNSFLFTGDAETQSELEMLRLGSQIKADVLKVGHHGSKTSSTLAFIKQVAPKYAIISVGKDNSYGHPTSDALERLNGVGATIFRTDESGTIVCESDGETITFKTLGSSVQPRAPSSVPVVVSPSPSSNIVTKSSSSPSQSNNQGVTVYGTRTGAKYHADGCRYLSKSKIPMTINDAKSSGLSPCSICNPPQ